jgi:hypothetical protein
LTSTTPLGVSATDARGGGGAFGSPAFAVAPGVARPAPLTEGIGARAGRGCGALRSADGSLPELDGIGGRAGGTAARETAASLEASGDTLDTDCTAAAAPAGPKGIV